MIAQLLNQFGEAIPPRPSFTNSKEAIITLGVEIVFDEKYCEFQLEEKNDLINSLKSHISYRVDEYQLAKDFESDGWSVDRDFVDKLETVTTCLDEALRKIGRNLV